MNEISNAKYGLNGRNLRNMKTQQDLIFYWMWTVNIKKSLEWLRRYMDW